MVAEMAYVSGDQLTASQALAWVVFRSSNRGNFIKPDPTWPGRASALMALAVAYGLTDESARYVDPIEAGSALIAACAAGSLTATGLRDGRGDRTSIPREWWIDAHLREGDAPYSLLARGRLGSSEWQELLFDRAALERLWPIPTAGAAEVATYVPFMLREERRKGPKRPYIGELYRTLRWIRHQNETLYYGSPFALAREVPRKWKPSAPSLPVLRNGRSTTLEAAIGQTRDGLEADIAAGITPEFPSTALATASR
jgi:hypothetical protein